MHARRHRPSLMLTCAIPMMKTFVKCNEWAIYRSVFKSAVSRCDVFKQLLHNRKTNME